MYGWILNVLSTFEYLGGTSINGYAIVVREKSRPLLITDLRMEKVFN